MRIILLIQSLIIIAGAYYVYTIRQGELLVVEPVVELTLPIETASSTIVPSVTDTPPLASSSSDDAAIVGPNDAGMEWPTLEEDLEVR